MEEVPSVSEQLAATVELLKQRKMLIGLPRHILKAVMGDDAAQILRQGMVYHHHLQETSSWNDCENEENRYFDWGCRNEMNDEGDDYVCITDGLNIVLRDLETLCEFPGGVDEAIGWLFVDPDWTHRARTRFDQLHDGSLLIPEGRKEVMMKADACVLVLIRAAIRDASKGSKLWNPSKLLKIFLDIREKHVRNERYPVTGQRLGMGVVLERDPSLIRSLRYLHYWHSRAVARLLVKRVSHDRLPAELSEMIEEHFYDAEELAALDAVAVRASESGFKDCGLTKPVLVRTERFVGNEIKYYV